MTPHSAELRIRCSVLIPVLLCLFSLVLSLAAIPAAAAPVSFVDHYGNTVTLPGPAQRVVTIPKPAPAMFMAVDGSSEKLVGVHPGSKAAIEEGIMKTIFPQSLAINTAVGNKGGYIPNVEEMVKLDPDIVFQWGNQGTGIVDPIRNAGLSVALVKYGNQKALATMLTAFGAVADKPEKAQQIIDWHQDTLKMLETKVGTLAEAEKPRVLFFIRALQQFKVAGAETYHGLCIDIAGGKNPAAADLTGYKVVSPEQILAWDPEVIFLNNFEPELSPAHLYDNPLLAGVSAVKNRRVYRAPLGGYRWDPPNQESPLMWKWLAMVFHPDRFVWDLRQEIRDRYRFLYNHTVTEEQIDAILRVSMHRDCRSYDRFAGR
jgi:iron complex transport system substrate-binding protein